MNTVHSFVQIGMKQGPGCLKVMANGLEKKGEKPMETEHSNKKTGRSLTAQGTMIRRSA